MLKRVLLILCSAATMLLSPAASTAPAAAELPPRPSPPTLPPPPPPDFSGQPPPLYGYLLLEQRGYVYGFGEKEFSGPSRVPSDQRAVDIESAPLGYWVVTNRGTVLL